MEGHNYPSSNAFVLACLRNELKPLNSEMTLAKIYTLEHLKQIAKDLSLSKVDKILNKSKSKGTARRYDLSKYIAKDLNNTRIGNKLSSYDHNVAFPYLTYYRLPSDSKLSALKECRNFLKEKQLTTEHPNNILFNALTSPPTRNLRLESLKLTHQKTILSLLYSCTRTLIKPGTSNNRTYENCFVCRIPVLVRFVYDYNLIEISLPHFYEPLAGAMRVEGNNPERFQELFSEAAQKIEGLFELELEGINFDNIPLHLEKKCKATDMGWQIEPQEEASFDLKQSVVPLKNILSGFTTSLARECSERKVQNPLKDIDLYKVFRSIKEQGYTCHMVQKVKLIEGKSPIKFSLIYGKRNKGLPPIISTFPYLQTNSGMIRYEIYRSQLIKYENPYALKSLLPSISIKFPEVPFEKIGIDPRLGRQIQRTIENFLQVHPDKSLDIQKISNFSDATGRDVKNIIYYLWNKRFIKASFLPYHKSCGKPIGKMELSVTEIEKNVEDVYYCSNCSEAIETIDDLDIVILFWSKHANVE